MATETLEPPVQQTSIPVPDAVRTQNAPSASSFSQRMAETRSKASQEKEGGEGASATEKAVVEARQARRESAKPKEQNVQQNGAEHGEEKDPFSILDELQTKGIEENGAAEDKTPPAPAGSTDKAVKTWKELNSVKDAALAERDQFKKELEELKGKVSPVEYEDAKKQLDALNKELSEAKKKIAAGDVRESEEYIKEVSGPCNQILTELETTAKSFGIPWRDLVDAIESPDRLTRNALLTKALASGEKEVDPVTQLEVVSAINEFIKRDAYGQGLLDNPVPVSEALKEKKAKLEQEQKTNVETQFNRTRDIVFDRMKEAIPQLKDDPEFAKQVLESVTLKEDPPHIKAMKDVWMASAVRVLKDHQEQHKKDASTIKGLEKRIADMTGASPALQHGEPEVKGDPALDDKRPLSARIAEARKHQGQ